jgi:hypothetical protein
MMKDQLKNQVLTLLKEAETSWSGFVDVDILAEKITETVASSKLYKPPITAPQPTPKPPSEAFEEAFSDHCGTVSATCELCGRTLFSSDLKSCGDDGEWEDCMKGMEKEPDKFILVDYDSVSLGTIGGRQVILGCPCNGLRPYEDFIWEHRKQIANYMERRLEESEKVIAERREQTAAIKKAGGLSS